MSVKSENNQYFKFRPIIILVVGFILLLSCVVSEQYVIVLYYKKRLNNNILQFTIYLLWVWFKSSAYLDLDKEL